MSDFSCSAPTDNDETNPKAQCQDGADNDSDGLVDMTDPGCATAQDNLEGDGTSQCQDGADNDSDGAIDMADYSCSAPTDNDETNPKAQCQDGVDNDNDGLTDLADPGCSSNAQDNNEGDGTSQCQDGLDNDSDGAKDMSDFSCSAPTDNDETNPKAQCQDGVDNDSDGLVDMTDPGCATAQDNNEGDGTSQCQDGVDNDADGAIDYPADISCSSKTDNDETNPKAQCQDGVDNDSDGLVDMTDPGCSTAQDNLEGDGTTQCQDGLDNDSDGVIDMADFSCSAPTDNDETNPKAQCQDGVDNDSDGLVDMTDPGCATAQDNIEGDGTTQCQDGLDNDSDGVIDMADFSCSAPTDNDETNPKAQCQDGLDNDKDGLIDLADPSCSSSQGNDESVGNNLPPPAPQNLSASDGSSPDFVQITWAAAPRASTYQLYRSDYEGELGVALNGPLSVTSYEDRSAVPGVSYWYTVIASNQFGDSDPSNSDSGFRYDPLREKDKDGDGVSDDQEEIDETDPNDRGSFQLHLKSPAFTKYNTYLRQWNFLELVANGTKTITAKVTVFLLSGAELVNRTVVLTPGSAQAQFDVNINEMIQQGCASTSLCAGLVDLDGNGVVDTYGVVRIDFNNELAGETMLGRMSNYRPDSDGNSYSFAFSKELRNPTKGITFGTGNTFDPQGLGYLVPNWVEIINLDSNNAQVFDYKLFNQEGGLVLSKVVTVPPLGERDVQGGHEIVTASGAVKEGVYLAQVMPRDGGVPYFATVSRYSSNSPAGVNPDSYNFAFALEGRAGSGGLQYMSISNEVGTGMSCYLQTNWVEVVNVREKPVTASLFLHSASGQTLPGGQINVEIPPRSQYHYNASVFLPKGEVGSAVLASSDKGALMAQSLVYYHDCSANKLQTAYVSQGRIAGQDVQAGSINTFLGMSYKLRVIGTSSAPSIVSGMIQTFDAGQSVVSLQIELPSFGINQVEGYTLAVPADRYGALTLRENEAGMFTAEVLRIRELPGIGVDFVMPTVVQQYGN